jgi:acetolactate synthase-1/2/3 large subunit
MVRQWQELFWDKHYSSIDLQASPDFVKLAEAFGAHGIRCTSPLEIEGALAEANSIVDRPTVLDMRIVYEENVFPMIPAGQGVGQIRVIRPSEFGDGEAQVTSSYVPPEHFDGVEETATSSDTVVVQK